MRHVFNASFGEPVEVPDDEVDAHPGNPGSGRIRRESHKAHTMPLIRSALVACSILNLYAAGAGPTSPAALRKVIESRRWFSAQFHATGLTEKEWAATPLFLDRLGRLPYAKDHAIMNPMIDLFVLSASCQHRCIPDSAWTRVDAIFDQALKNGLNRILVTFTFKLDPADKELSQYCAVMEKRDLEGRLTLAPAVANHSGLPQYANAEYQARVKELLCAAIQRMETKYGASIIGYEPVGGVAGEIDWEGGTSTSGELAFGDLSPSMMNRFREHLKRFAKGTNDPSAQLAVVNRRFGTHFNTWDQVKPPSRYAGPGASGGDGSFSGPIGQQYALSRYIVMREFYKSLKDITRELAASKLFSLRLGCILETGSVRRGTIFFQQFAQAIHPDLMVSDASMGYNHEFEGPLVAATRYRPAAGGGARRLPDSPIWFSYVDRFPEFTKRGIDYREASLKQIKRSFEKNGFNIVGFFIAPSEFNGSSDYLTFLTSLDDFYQAAPETAEPVRFVSLRLSWVVRELTTAGYGPKILPFIRQQTHSFNEKVAIILLQDIAEP